MTDFTAETPAPFVLIDGERVLLTDTTTAALSVALHPAPAHSIPKLRFVDRLIAAGLIEAALAALAADAIAKVRFDAAIEIDSSDAQARALLAAIGADVDAIMAP